MATTPQFDLKGHLLSLKGLTRESTTMARFYDADSEIIAERAVTADECWSAGSSCWSNFMLADGPSAKALGAASVSFVLPHTNASAGPTVGDLYPNRFRRCK
jgi:hypothetical protein